MIRIKTPLRYPGGKTIYKNMLLEVMELNGLKKPTYVEPYAGGAGAAISLLLEENVSDIILNDADIRIYAFWKSILNTPHKFIEKMMNTKIDMEEWQKQKTIYTEKNSTQFEIGFATFFLNRTNRSGILNAGPIGGKQQNGNYKMDVRFNKEELAKRILEISKRKKQIQLFNLDAEEFLARQEKESDSNRFIYLDPPYYEQGGNLYMNHYKHQGHENLSNFMKITNSKNWLMSYDYSNRIYDMYKHNPKYSYSLNYSAQSKRLADELIITSPNLVVPDSLRAC